MSEVITIKVPDIGTSTGVEVIEILAQVGQTIEQDDPLITLESDKASMDIPSPHAGQVESVLVQVGDKVSEGDPIVQLKAEQEGAQRQTSEQEPTEEQTKQQAEENSKPKAQENSEQKTSKAGQQSHSSETNSVETFHLPDLGTEAKVELIEWAVSEGDTLEKDQTLLTLESDKASMDVPSPFDGVLVKTLAQVGDKVTTGSAVAEIRVQGTQASKNDSSTTETQITTQSKPQEATQVKPQAQATIAPVDSDLPSQVGAHAGPGVRRLAHQLGVDLTQVKGTGRKQRITYPDVHAFVKGQLKQKGPGQGGLGVEPMSDIDFSQWGEVEIQPLNRIKRLTAKNLHRNWVTIPHVTQFDEADITELEAFRKENKASAKEMGISLTPLAFLIKACVSSLKAYPQFNASLASNQQDLILKKYFHIGVAVDTPSGLVVPVILDVDRKGVFQIAQELGALSHQARQGQLKVDQMKGSCFTLSSLGAQGGTQFTPIINAPDVAILGVSRSEMKPVYQDGTFVPRLMLPLALSYDHRVIDGVEGAKFMRHLCAQCEDIRKLLL